MNLEKYQDRLVKISDNEWSLSLTIEERLELNREIANAALVFKTAFTEEVLDSIEDSTIRLPMNKKIHLITLKSEE